MEKIKCLFCSENGRVFWIENGYIGRKCDRCRLIYISPRPDEKEMIELYEKGQAGGKTAIEYERYSFSGSLVVNYTINLIKQFKKTGDLLEVGSGGGQFLISARDAGFNPFAVEINKEQAGFISRELGVKTENKSGSDRSIFGAQKFDVIYHKDLLSHLHQPIETFKNFNNKLKDDGILIFETGNSGSLSRLWIKFLGRMSYPEHLYSFSERSVIKLLALSDFELVRYYHHAIVLPQLLAKLLKPVKNIKKVSILKEKIRSEKIQSRENKVSAFQKIGGFIFYFLTYRIGRLLPHSWPSTIIYIAKKNE
jgi:2-polyprenyl-3-methyl-5-hydroxy-6-metoxy-1,4-benzoquinol methylase